MISLTKKALYAVGFCLITSVSGSYGNCTDPSMNFGNKVPYYNYSGCDYPAYSYPGGPDYNYLNTMGKGCANVADCSYKTPLPSECKQSCGKSSFAADFIYWRAYESGLDACVPSCSSDTMFPDGRIISLFDGKRKDPHFKWSPGFRITGGYEFSDRWAFALTWTHLNTDAKSEKHRFQHLHWRMNLNILDLLASYSYSCHECFSLRPFFGLRGASIDQKLRLGASPNSTTFAASLDEAILGNHNKEDFIGVGPLFGLEADLKLGKGFSLYASGSISWIYGHTEVKFVDSLTTFDVIDYSHVKKQLDSVLTAADAAFGISWQKRHCGFLYSLKLGFEHHQFFDYNRFNGSGDLSFDGITCGLGIEF